MKRGDRVLLYHSISEKAVVGIAEIYKKAFLDATDDTGKWIAVKIKLLEKFVKAVALNEIKAEKFLENLGLIKQSRLSVMPQLLAEFKVILQISNKIIVSQFWK